KEVVVSSAYSISPRPVVFTRELSVEGMGILPEYMIVVIYAQAKSQKNGVIYLNKIRSMLPKFGATSCAPIGTCLLRSIFARTQTNRPWIVKPRHLLVGSSKSR